MALEGEGFLGDKDGLEYEINMLVVGQRVDARELVRLDRSDRLDMIGGNS